VPTPNSGRFGENAADVADESVSPARGGMQTYDAFAARVTARGDGVGTDRPIASSDDRRSNPPSSTSHFNARLATLPECYDAYVSLHRSGLWFDVNPFYHPELRCYYLRCEPAKVLRDATKTTDDDVTENIDDKRTTKERRSRAVIVPVATRVARVSHATLRNLSRLGDAWRREGKEEDLPEPNEKEKEDAEAEASFLFRGDAVPKIGVSLCLVDGDGTAVVLNVNEGLVEPEDVDPPAEDLIDLLADDATDGDETRLGNGSLNRQGVVGFSDDETEDLDERDAGEVGGAERGAFDREGPERLLDEENGN
jgi:hypothetical protein